ncbi:High mobility group protein 20A [Armadillidium nasatum]|uniref:High mobility group protein 20A n=1 Tax=Armadillidium nasatum TaxID=96803 RepID=A0A5N5TQ01_9CRUS|nr:High mobility group protein 20A [Armadillidium nasatum]
MKKVYKLSSPSVMRNTLVNESPDVSYNESVKYDTIEGDKKFNTLENSQNNIPQYKVITVPVHKIKILNVKKTSLPLSTFCQITNTVNNSSVVVDKEVTKVSTKPISTDKIAKNVNKNQVCNQIEDDSDAQLISPSSRWLSQPRSYRGAKKDYSQRKIVRKISVSSFVDTTDGETSGMGSSVDEPVESSTESASEAPSSFLQPRQSSRPLSISPSTVKKRRGGWPKGRKRKPEPPGVKTPKAPQTAYVLFLNERRKFYKETHPNLPFVEVTKLLGAEWSSMTQAQKAVYMTRSEQDKKRYRNELQTFRQSPDYQILLRKKRIKNVINRGQTTEESSDFTDEVDDDDSEELHCRTCDQWFSSIHNKREHLYGKPHLQAITGEYQREREAEMRRRMASPTFENLHSSKLEEQTIIPEIRINNEDGEKEDKPSVLDGCSGRRDSIGVTSTTEDDRDDDDDDDGDVDDEEEEDSEYDDEGEVTEEEGSSKVSKEACGSCNFFSERVTDAAEGVINKVLNREMEIRFLRNRYEKSRRNQRQIYSTLATLQNKQKLLQEKQQRLIQEEKTLMEKAESLAKISELCKNGIQLRNSERESDEKENRQLETYSSSDSVPYGKLNRFCENSSNLLPPDSSTSQEISDSSLFLGDNKNDNVVVLSDQGIKRLHEM